MTTYKLLLFLTICCFSKNSFSQNCTALGQTPASAYPVCGTVVFIQNTVAFCGGADVLGACPNAGATDINPYWYKFTCYQAGSIGFTIAPNDLNDDYDWELFDVTGQDPSIVYTNAAIVVSCNWSGIPGITGSTNMGSNLFECGFTNAPPFSKMGTLIPGHNYLLLISHFTQTQSGYSLTFAGGTANITPPYIAPHLLSVNDNCNGEIITKLNKKINCSTIKSDGSNFKILSATNQVTGAAGVGCSTGFETDSIVITLQNPLPEGSYQLTLNSNNNLSDLCNNVVPVTDTINLLVRHVSDNLKDSLTKPGCAPESVQIVFIDSVLCNSIASDGSDFIITGPDAVKIISASALCSADGKTNKIKINLSAPIKTSGFFLLSIKTGDDGNTILNNDYCNTTVTIGKSFGFKTADTVFATFNTIFKYGCQKDTISYYSIPQISVSSWQWNFNNSRFSTAPDNTLSYPLIYDAKATLIVSNGTCSDTTSTVINFNTLINASFEMTSIVCPGDSAIFINKTNSNPNYTWLWNFGNGETSTLQFPKKELFVSNNITQNMPVKLIVTNTTGCSDSTTNFIKVIDNCYIAVPNAFSPNGDGLNDYLFPNNGYKAKDLYFAVYNRTGLKIFESRDWASKWDGSYNQTPQAPGTYVWTLTYINIETGKKISLKGATLLIR